MEEGEAYNVVIDVENPVNHDAIDQTVIKLVDSFLKKRSKPMRISTVVNTIFPRELYQRFGSPGIYAEYHKFYDSLTTSKKWGRYFERMTRHRTLDSRTYNPLQDLIDKIRSQLGSGQRFKAAHELAVYDPLLDRRYRRGGQCLSFLSFKLHPLRGLMLTAIYRNHHYITRCLGNLIGLGQLQAFVAKEAGIEVGSLTCLSTHAELDVDGGKGWTLSGQREILYATRPDCWTEMLAASYLLQIDKNILLKFRTGHRMASLVLRPLEPDLRSQTCSWLPHQGGPLRPNCTRSERIHRRGPALAGVGKEKRWG